MHAGCTESRVTYHMGNLVSREPLSGTSWSRMRTSSQCIYIHTYIYIYIYIHANMYACILRMFCMFYMYAYMWM